MGVTAFSFILLPLSLLWLSQPMRLLQLIYVASIFEAAAALTVGSLGVQPGLVPALAFMGYVSLQLLLGAQYPGRSQVWRMTMPFVLVSTWAILSSYLIPRAFEGKVMVWPQKATPPFVLTPLEPSPSNMNQDFYLLLNTVFLVLVAMFLTRSRLNLRSILNGYFVSVFLAAGVAVWQFGSKVAHLPYPDSLFYSNPGWAILTEQSIGPVPRINGSFSEPSSLGSYMAAAVCATVWLMLQGHRQRVLRVLFVVGLTCVLLSTSTTGFAVLAIAGAGLLGGALITGSARLMSGVLKIALPLLLLLGFLVVVAGVFSPAVIANVQQVMEATANKKDSSSYNDRTSADVDSLKATVESYGLGAGWGSNRSSSLLPGLFAGIGVPGVAGLVWFGGGLVGRVRWARRAGCSADQLLVIDGCCGALVGLLVGALISAPSITSVSFFFFLALLIGCVARVEVDAQTRRLNINAAASAWPTAARAAPVDIVSRAAGAPRNMS